MSYRTERKEVAQQESGATCRYCGAVAPYEQLSIYGARCGKCYEAFMLGNRERVKYTREDKVDILAGLRSLGAAPENPRAWAHRLHEREAAGEYLTPPQRQAWREALRATLDVPVA